MNKLTVILALSFACTFARGQNPASYTELGSVVNAFYEALSTADSAKRAAAFLQLFTPKGQVNAVIQKSVSTSTHALGSWKEFLENSSAFYNTYSIDYDEVEREVDYYVDLGSVHSLVYQTATDRKTGNTYRQMLWFQADLVYSGNRWYIDHVTWINETTDLRIEDALLQDTLWHKPSR